MCSIRPPTDTLNWMGKSVTYKPVRVLLMDLLSIVPYYTGHLCVSLTQVQGIDVTLGSITYSHDRSFFKRMKLRNDPGFLDIAYSLPNAVAPLRSAFKVFEYLLNMATWTLRFVVSKPDIIHVQFIPLVNYNLSFELWFLKLAQKFGIKLVYTVHNVLPQDTGELHRAAYAKIYRLIDGFICHDLCAKARLVSEFNVSPDRVSVIPHGPLFGPAGSTIAEQVRARAGLPKDACIVLWQGIVRPYKGISFLLKAWKMARKAGLTGVLVIVGTGEKSLLRAIEDEVFCSRHAVVGATRVSICVRRGTPELLRVCRHIGLSLQRNHYERRIDDRRGFWEGNRCLCASWL